MKRILKTLLASALLSAGLAQAGPVLSTSYAGIAGTTLNFDNVVAGADGLINGLLTSGGVSFGERFAGQVLSMAKAPRPGEVAQDWFDDLSTGAPTAGLSLLAGASGHNLGVYDYGDSRGQALAGVGPSMADGADPFGFGALSARFAIGQSSLGFYLRDGDGGAATLNLYRTDGSLIQSLALGPVADGYYAFARDGGVADIAGFSLYNRDSYYGISIDELRFASGAAAAQSVPEPGTAALLALGLMGALRSRRKR
ncbi:PEP-CTERM sorting domain-containing protein [Pelomonas sp. SE-A7]|uniref:PEP-CTERM sorting domain-containing protein n=1 Tax=Pelomonas sp. SE-A7 TaxID=3054953 RepID=UPI00259C7585|nr:PEP-CTERM sorting domain-containing protein [Pelomonas sp. SE-A7]MDM4765796.1 PEP-CTERM sorting domain-containing protein [Pelomonas sp. SE-A7]